MLGYDFGNVLKYNTKKLGVTFEEIHVGDVSVIIDKHNVVNLALWKGNMRMLPKI